MSIKELINEKLEIVINFFPTNLYIYELQGDKTKGKIEFRSEEIIDDYWGSYITAEYSWETIPFDERDSDGDLINELDIYFSKMMPVQERIQKYIQSSFVQYLIGARVKHVKGHPYPINEIHGVWYDDHTERVINFKFVILREIFADWKPTLIQMIESVRFNL
ncbi:MAG: hypothetical protein EAX96_16080 [Candidatus Lokiarchaeota archaeon]|nr:hypothetical protein [Candidatus Lokiarchaeota archaeon]